MGTTMLDRPPDTRHGSSRWWWVLATVVVLAVAGGVTALALHRAGGAGTPAPPASAAPAAPGTTGAAQAPATTGGAPSAAPAVPGFRFQPLWPFGSVAEAVRWQQEANPGGHQPWHLTPESTALVFTQTYLGFGAIDRDLGTTLRGDEAWVKVGFRAENGTDLTAAVLHLARIGGGDRQPWEVVGSQDTTLTLTTPAYGARIASPVTVGGRITGIDESLRIQVLGLGAANPLGTVNGVGAGGQNAPWSATVSFRQSTGTVRTIVVSATGQLDGAVKQFAITGVRVG